MQVLRIGYLSTMYHTSHIIKQLKWVEKFLSLKADWQLFGTGPSMVEAFAAGVIDLGYIELEEIVI